MNDRLKDRILKLTNRLIVSLVLVAGMVCCGTLAVYGAEEGLTEEEVKQQVLEIIEEENQGEITDYTIVEYDIDKIYPIISLDFFVNDYIDGMTFGEIVEEQEKEHKKLNGDNQYTYWHMPYENYLNEKCIITFLTDDEIVEVVTRAVDTETDYDMKLYEGKHEEISLEDVKKHIYINLDLYGFKITYLCMNEGEEYVIPYLHTGINNWCNFECGKIYTTDEFVTKLYNSYKESKDEENKRGKANLKLFVSARKRKLECSNIEQVRMVEWIHGFKFLIIALVFFAIVGIFLIVSREKKKKI